MKTVMGRLAVTFLSLLAASAAWAEADRIRIAVQPGMSLMPLVLMREMKLVEGQLAKRGLSGTVVEYRTLSGGPSQNDALLSGSIDYASGGTPSMLLLWDRTRSTRNPVVGVASMASIPQQLFSRNPDVRSIADFTDKDRIAMPAIRVSLMAILLQMAAAQQWGPDQWNRLDRLTVSLPHAEATIMLSAKTPTEITAHFSGPPQMYQQRRDPNLRMVLDSTSITGGPITQNAVWASREFVDKNPQLHGAVFAAIEEAMAFVNEQPLAATRTYLKAESWSLDPDEIAAGLKEPGVTFSIVPVRTMFFAEFMNRVGLIKQVPASWQELWVKDLHQRPGS